MTLNHRLISSIDTFLSSAVRDWRFLIVAAGVPIFGFLFFQISVAELFFANKGSSVLHWFYLSVDSLKQQVDWPTGTRNLGRSLPIQIIYQLHSLFGIEVDSIIIVYVVIEVLASFSAYFFFFMCFGKQPNNFFLAIFFSLTVSLTFIQSVNLANFSQPFHWGLYYSLAGSFRIVGLGLILIGRPKLSCLSLLLSFMCHPLIGMVGFFAAGILCLAKGWHETKKYLRPAVLTSLGIVAWTFLNFSDSNLNSGNIPADVWVHMTKLFNFHFYPQSIGVFHEMAHKKVFPLLAITTLYAFLIFHSKKTPSPFKFMTVVVLGLFALVLFGLMNAFYETSPFLIKLCLHRACDLLVVIMFAVLLPKLVDDIISGPWHARVTATAFLIQSVVSFDGPNFSLPLAILYCLSKLWSDFKNSEGRNYRLIKLYLWLFLILLEGAYSILHLVAHGKSGFIHTFLLSKRANSTLIEPSFALFLTISFVSLLILTMRNRSGIVCFLLFVILSISIPSTNYAHTKRFSTPRHVSYLETQNWARENTAPATLFMIDPSGSGAWRDLSTRASYGTLTEWLSKSWMYDSDQALFDEGVRRAKLFGVHIDEILKDPISNRQDRTRILRAIRMKAQSEYYRADEEFFRYLAEVEGVNYFVFERALIKKARPWLDLKFQNRFYSIYQFSR